MELECTLLPSYRTGEQRLTEARNGRSHQRRVTRGNSVAGSPERLRVLLKMRSYLLYLSSVGKNTFDTTNLLVVTAEQLLDSIGGRKQAAPANQRLERTQ